MLLLDSYISDLYRSALDALNGTYTLRILQSFFEIYFNILPYLLISILLQVVLIHFIQKGKISLVVKNKVLAIVVGSLLGMLSPLPTYAAIPIGLALIPLGLPLGAVMAFVIASPLINPSIFFLTATQLGMGIAMARVASTFIISLIGGFLFGYVLKSLQPLMLKTKKVLKERPFHVELWRSARFFGKYFTIAIFISAVVKAVVSPELVTQILGHHIQRSLLVAITPGVPFYSCGGAAIPFVEVLSDMGMDKGAVLAFFIAGPATKLETMYMFKSLMGIKYFVIYLLLTLVGAYFSGLIYS